MGEASNRSTPGSRSVTNPGSALLELAAASQREFVMCAPFAKEHVVTKVLSAVPAGVRVWLFTRWRPEEVAVGVSDTQVLSVVRSRGGVVYLYDQLHAKYYRNEQDVLLGSANLTATALGWNQNPNLELLVTSTQDAIETVEHILYKNCMVATDQLAREVDEIAALLPSVVRDVPAVRDAGRPDIWIPSLRMPSDLYTAYRYGSSSLAARSGEAAAEDLSVLDLPPGLDRGQFEALVAHRLRNMPVFAHIEDFLSEPRRFGEMRQLLARIARIDRKLAEESWQTTMRWMFEFLPQRYQCSTFRHSEVVSLTTSRVSCKQ